jgi:hypothetical protein
LLGIGSGLLGIGSGLLGIGSGLLGIGSGLLEIGSGLLGIGSGLLGIGDGLLRTESGLLGLGEGCIAAASAGAAVLPEDQASDDTEDGRCWGVLYCTITLTVFVGFDISGSRSGEIFETSAKATRAANTTTQTTMARASCLECLGKNDCISLPQSNHVQGTLMLVQSDNCGQDYLGVTEGNEANINLHLKLHDSATLRSD